MDQATHIQPNLDHKISLPKNTLRQIRVTNYPINDNDIILDGLVPALDFCLSIPLSNDKLVVVNDGHTTVTLVEKIIGNPKALPILTEIHPGKKITISRYIDFVYRYFTFVAFTSPHRLQKIVQLGINTTTDDKTLFLVYKII